MRAGLSFATDSVVAEDTTQLDRILGCQYHAVAGNPPYITPKDAAMRDAYREIYTSCHMKYGLGAPGGGDCWFFGSNVASMNRRRINQESEASRATAISLSVDSPALRGSRLAVSPCEDAHSCHTPRLPGSTLPLGESDFNEVMRFPGSDAVLAVRRH
jgi:hypothetical protein